MFITFAGPHTHRHSLEKPLPEDRLFGANPDALRYCTELIISPCAHPVMKRSIVLERPPTC